MAHRFDATVKDIFANPQDLAGVFDFPNILPAQALNVDLSTISAATDIAFGFGKPLQEIVDLNFQTGPDAAMPARVHLYNAAYYLRYGVPVRSLVVLLRPKADGAHLNGSLAYVAGGRRIQFEYDVVRMWKQPVGPFLSGGLGLLPLSTLCELPADRPLTAALREIIREIDRRLSAETDHAQAVRLMTASFILTGLRVEKEMLAHLYEGVRIMHESTAYDVWVEEGEKRGEKRGEERGEKRGMFQGEKLGKIRLLTLIGNDRFGTIDPTTALALEAIDDLDRLERMAVAMSGATSWEDLLATP